jgi:hypothetical protein
MSGLIPLGPISIGSPLSDYISRIYQENYQEEINNRYSAWVKSYSIIQDVDEDTIIEVCICVDRFDVELYTRARNIVEYFPYVKGITMKSTNDMITSLSELGILEYHAGCYDFEITIRMYYNEYIKAIADKKSLLNNGNKIEGVDNIKCLTKKMRLLNSGKK